MAKRKLAPAAVPTTEPPSPPPPAGTTRCCPACGSPAVRVLHRHEQAFAGRDAAGRPYTHVVRERMACEACGQVRIGRRWEDRA